MVPIRQPMPEALQGDGLANTMTGFANLFAGCTCLALSRLLRPQPASWRFAYWMVVLSGVATVALHGFGGTVSGYAPRWLGSFLDTGSNVVIAWALALAVLSDYYAGAVRIVGRLLLTIAMLAGVGWHLYDRLLSSECAYRLRVGDWGSFDPGEALLIALCFGVAGLLLARWRAIPPRARPLLASVLGIFLVGMLLATARSREIVPPYLAVDALWHLVAAFGLVFLWAFNHVCCEERAQSSTLSRLRRPAA